MMTELTLEEKIACEKEYRANPLTITFEEGQEKRKDIDKEWCQRRMQLDALRYLNDIFTNRPPETWKYALDNIKYQIAFCLDVAEKYQIECDKKFRKEHLRIDFATYESFTYLTQQQ